MSDRGWEGRPGKHNWLPILRQNRIRRQLSGGALATSEGDREAEILGDNNILMMRNHGPIVVGPTIAAAFDRLYYLEEVCRRQILAMSTEKRLQQVPSPVVSEDISLYDAYAQKHLAAIKRVLDREEPEYSQ